MPSLFGAPFRPTSRFSKRTLVLLLTFAGVVVAFVGVALSSSSTPHAQEHAIAGTSKGEISRLDWVPSTAAPPSIRVDDHARIHADAIATDLHTRLVNLRLRALASQWGSADEEKRAELLESMGDIDAERLVGALEVQESLSYEAPTGRITGSLYVGGRLSSYVAYVPEDYTPDRSWPVHIALHGGGSQSWRACDRNWGEEGPSAEGMILICPGASKSANWWMPQGEKAILETLALFRSRYNIDTDEISIGGASSGGFGAWHAATKFPWLWRAAIVRCAATPRLPEALENLGEVPAFVVHGNADMTISVHNSRMAYSLLSATGHPVEYVEVEGMGHAFGRKYNPQILDWLDHQERSFEAAFDYKVVRRASTPTRLHWMIPQWKGRAREGTRVAGAIKRAPAISAPSPKESAWAANEVTIDTDANLTGFTVFLQDALWNSERPVVVRYNGREVYRGQPEPSVRAVLDSWAVHEDPSMIATHEIGVVL